MKRDELEKLGLTKEQIDTIMDANGKDINEAKKEADKKAEAIKVLEEKVKEVGSEFTEYKKSKMTEEEKQKAIISEENARYEKAITEAETIKSDYSRLIKESKVKETLGSLGNDEEVKGLIQTFIADTEEESVTRATTFKQYVEKQRETAATAAVEKALKETPIPKTGDTIPPKPYEVKQVW